jgi:ATP-dependent helicase HepA
VVCDEQGRDLSQTINEEFINQRAGRIPKATTQQLIAHARENINTLSEQATKLATQAQQQVITDAVTMMNYQLNEELQRLEFLTKVNPNIRDIEVEYLKQSKQLLTDYLEASQLSMDAVRIIIVTESS